jgi:uncharacterized protein YndB with AHSA1/START domain
MKVVKIILAILILIVAIFFGNGLITPSVDYKCSVEIDKSIEETWAVMGDESRMSEWLKGYIKSETVSGDPFSIGAVSNIYFNENGQEMVIQETITKIVPLQKLAMKYSAEFMDMNYEMTTEFKDGKTHLNTISSSVGNGLFAKSIMSFMGSALEKQEIENLSNLKKVVEQNTKNYFPQPAAVDSL